MEIKQVVVIQVTKDEHTFQFYMPLGSSWGKAIDASFEILSEVQKMAANAVNTAKPAAPESEQMS